MKKILSLILSMALCLTLAACNNTQARPIDDITPNLPLPASPAVSATPAGTPAESDIPVDHDTDLAYYAALENLIQNHVLPGDIDVGDVLGDTSENKFAIYDVDNDGKEELIILYSTTITAGMAGCIFAYDGGAGALRTELQEFPMLTFYKNGTVKALWSHNQGRAGDAFWPYSLYRYNADTDSYTLIGMVDAWDKSYPGAGDQNDQFPSETDKSGTGIVYYIMEDGQYDNTNPVDAAEYDAWVNTHIGAAAELQIRYMDLTEENISQIKNG